jgi:putative tryptophan/tyrosine transport system substrate-binding protein
LGAAEEPTRRREIITLLGGAVVWPRIAHTRQSGMPAIGFLHTASPATYVSQMSAFRQVLKETGYVAGQNMAIEYRWAADQISRLPILGKVPF